MNSMEEVRSFYLGDDTIISALMSAQIISLFLTRKANKKQTKDCYTVLKHNQTVQKVLCSSMEDAFIVKQVWSWRSSPVKRVKRWTACCSGICSYVSVVTDHPSLAAALLRSPSPSSGRTCRVSAFHWGSGVLFGDGAVVVTTTVDRAFEELPAAPCCSCCAGTVWMRTLKRGGENVTPPIAVGSETAPTQPAALTLRFSLTDQQYLCVTWQHWKIFKRNINGICSSNTCVINKSWPMGITNLFFVF